MGGLLCVNAPMVAGLIDAYCALDCAPDAKGEWCHYEVVVDCLRQCMFPTNRSDFGRSAAVWCCGIFSPLQPSCQRADRRLARRVATAPWLVGALEGWSRVFRFSAHGRRLLWSIVACAG